MSEIGQLDQTPIGQENKRRVYRHGNVEKRRDSEKDRPCSNSQSMKSDEEVKNSRGISFELQTMKRHIDRKRMPTYLLHWINVDSQNLCMPIHDVQYAQQRKKLSENRKQ